MSNSVKILVTFSVFILTIILFFGFARLTADDLDLLLSSDEPFGILVALIDKESSNESLEALAQMVVFPKQKRIFFYFVNTDARLDLDDDAIKTQSPSASDYFSKFTNIKNSYKIVISRKSAIRLIDLVGGITFFLEEPGVFDKQLYTYPQGVHYFPGKQFLEYTLARKTSQPNRAWLNGVDRLQRIESMLLNLLWRKNQFKEQLKTSDLSTLALSLFDTNLPSEEFNSLLDFMGQKGVRFSVLEIPLKSEAIKRKNILVIKTKSARIVFNQFRENIEASRDKSKSFPVEVLNGTEIGGLARRVKQFLQDNGLLVLDADNYGYKPVPNSIIVERSGDTFKAKYLQEITGLKHERIVFQRSHLDVQGSFIIGDDFKIIQLK